MNLNDVVIFSDTFFEYDIRKSLGNENDPVLVSDLAKIEKIECDEFIGEDIKYLPFCTGLKYLYIDIPCQDYLEYIKGLTNLEALEISINDSTHFDFETISTLTNLKLLSVLGWMELELELTNLYILSKFDKLNELILYQIEEIDLSFIETIPNLQTFSLQFVKENVRNIESIAKNKALTHLYFCDFIVDDLDFLNRMNENVYLDFCAMTVNNEVKKSTIDRFKNTDIREMKWKLV